MKHLSKDAKLAIVKKALNSETKTVTQIAREHNVGLSTLEKWLKNYRNENPLEVATKGKKQLSTNLAEQLNHVIATANLDETSLGAYCREHGLYSHQINEWKNYFMTDHSKFHDSKLREELRKYKQENKQLKQDLSRKDKALAETSALLILKKKANLIWGDLEDD